MSTEVENRIVRMQFQNENFERNATKSMSTLDKLKKALKLDHAGDDWDEFQNRLNNLDFTGLVNGIDNVLHNVPLMEQVVSRTITRMADGISSAALQMGRSLTIEPVAAGFEKYNQEATSVMTLMNSTGASLQQVYKWLDQLMWFSDETSYSFTDMTQSLSTMVANGGDIEKLIPMIMGIANATAYAGKGSAEFNRSIYNLAQSYSAGNLQLIDWKSVQNAGVNSKALVQTFIDAGIALGQLDEEGRTAKGTLVDLGSFSETLSEKWLNSEVMEAAFGHFSEFTMAAKDLIDAGEYDSASEAYADMSEKMGDAFDELSIKAAQAAQQYTTFKDVVDATKDAVSTGWMSTWQIIFGDYEQAKQLWSQLGEDMWEIFASGASARNAFLKEALQSNFVTFDDWLNMSKEGTITQSVIENIKAVAEEYGVELEEITEDSRGLSETLDQGWLSIDMFNEALRRSSETLEETDTLAGKTVSGLDDVKKVVDDVYNLRFGTGQERIRKLTEAGWDFAAVQELVNQKVRNGAVNWDELTEEQLKTLGVTVQVTDATEDATEEVGEFTKSVMERKSGRTMLVEAFFNVLEGAMSILDSFKEAISTVFKIEPEGLTNLAEKVLTLSEGFKFSDKALEGFKNTFSLALLPIRIGVSVIGKLASLAVSVASVFGRATVSIFEFIGALTGAKENAEELGEELEPVGTAFEKTGNFIDTIRQKIGDFISDFKNLEGVQRLVLAFQTAFSNSGNRIVSAIEWIISKVTGASVKIGKLNLGEAVLMGFDGIADIMASVVEAFDSGAESIGIFLNTVGEGAAAGFDHFIQSMQTFIETKGGLDGIAKSLGAGIVSPIKTIIGWIQEATARPEEITQSATQGITNFVSAIVATLSSVTVKDVLSGSGFIAGMYALVNVVKLLKSLTSSVGTIRSGAIQVLNSVRGAIAQYTKTLKADTIVKVAKAIAILAGSIFVLAMIDPMRLANVAVDLSVVLLAIAAVIAAMGLGVDSVSDLASEIVGSVDALKKSFGKMLVELGKAAKWASLGLMFVSMAISIGVLVGAFFALTKIVKGAGSDNVATSMLVILSMMAGMGIIAAELSRMPPIKLSVIFSMLMVATSLGLLVNVLQKISEMMGTSPEDKNGFIADILALAGIAWSLGQVMKGFGAVGGNIPKATKFIKQLSKTMLYLAAALFVINKLDDFYAAFEQLTMVIGVFAFFATGMAALSVFYNGGIDDTINSITSTILKFVAIMALVQFLKLEKAIIPTLAVLVTTLGSLGAAAVIFGHFAVPLLAGAQTLKKFLEVLFSSFKDIGIFAAGVAVFLVVIVVLKNSINNIIEALGALLVGLVALAPAIGQAIGALFAGILRGIADYIDDIIEAIAVLVYNLFLGIAKGIVYVLGDAEANSEVWEAFFEWGKNAAEMIFEGLWWGIKNLPGSLGRLMLKRIGLDDDRPTVTTEAMKSALYYSGDIYRDLVEQYKEGLLPQVTRYEGLPDKALARELLTNDPMKARYLAENFGVPGNKKPELPKSMADYPSIVNARTGYETILESTFDEYKKTIEKFLGTEVTPAVQEDIMARLDRNLMTRDEKVTQTIAREEMEKLIEALKEEAETRASSGEISEAVSAATEQGLVSGTVEGSKASVESSAEAIHDSSKEATVKGVSGISDGIMEWIQNGSAEETGNILAGTLAAKFTSPLNLSKSRDSGYEFVKALTEGQMSPEALLSLTGASDALGTETIDMLTSFAGDSGNIDGTCYGVGIDWLAGLGLGIDENTDIVEEAAANAALKAQAAAEKALDINSPSKVSYGTGEFWVAGFVNAIRDRTVDAAEVAKRLADETIQTTRRQFEVVGRNNYDIFGSEFTIRPTLDLTGVVRDAKRIDSLLGDRGIGVSGASASDQVVINLGGVTFNGYSNAQGKAFVDDLNRQLGRLRR